MPSEGIPAGERDATLAPGTGRVPGADDCEGARGPAGGEAGRAQDVAERVPDVPATVRGLWDAAAGMRWRLVVAVLASVAHVGFTLAAPAYSAHVIDLLWANIQASFAAGAPFVVTLDNGGTQILAFFGLWTASWLFYTVQVMVMASFAERLNLSLRRRVSAKLARLPLAYYDAHQPGDTISRATNDLDKVSEVLQRGLLQLVIAVLTLVGSVAMMATLDLALAGVFVGFACAAGLVTRLFARRVLAAAAARQEAMGTLTGAVEEGYSGRAVVKAFGRERASASQVRAAAEEVARASARADFLAGSLGPAERFLVRLSLVGIGTLAGGMLLAGRISVGVVQAFFQYVTTAGEPLTQLSQTTSMLQGAVAAAARVLALLAADEVEPDPARPAELPRPVRGRVAFEHVRFGYDAGRPLMRDVSLVAEPGQKVAIVGATGAGKTTLVNLLMRFYEIWGGRITLDGVDTRELPQAELRAQLGMVLQDAWLFEGTVAENIAYGRPGATRAEVEAAARAAHVDFFVHTLPEGYDTVLAADSEEVSQGQRQLLTIARAMLRDPAILILDEATSSVDTRTEQEIVRAMEALMSGRTSFVIAHRLSTVVDADLILVMEAGTIVEQGTHDELMAAGATYAELYESQFA